MKKAPPSTVFGTNDIAELKHGFSRYFDRFDPYEILKVSAYKKPAQRALAMMRNTLTRAQRTFDALLFAQGVPSALCPSC